MKTRLDLAIYGVQEMTVAETLEVNGGLSEVTRWLIEAFSYNVHRTGSLNLTPTAMDKHRATMSMIN